MTGMLRAFLGELGHLFVDDGSLAMFAGLLILVVAGAVKLLDVPPLWAAVALALGLAGVLVESLARAARAGRKR